jgi:type I restriction enzyme S subunit
VNYGRFDPSENKALPSSLEPLPALEIRPGDVLMSRANTRELVGSAVFVDSAPPRLMLCDKVFRLRYVPTRTAPRFLTLALESRIGREQVERDATGASSSMQNIGQDSIRRLLLAWPPFVEQTAIVEYLDRETAKLDQMTAKVEAAIERLQEYRTALITAAVTGKIDVRRAEAKIAIEA